MAISLTMENFSYAEPMRKNRFLVQFNAAGGLAGTSPESLTLACHSSTIPQLTVESKELHRFNDRVYFPGKGSFNDVSISFYEYINNSDKSSNNKSAGDILWDWSKKVYNPSTGTAGYKRDLSTGVLIAQFDGEGNIIRSWNLYHAWPTTVEFDELDSTSDGEAQNVKVTLRYDWAAMVETPIKEPEEQSS